jgi:hypothetical protein
MENTKPLQMDNPEEKFDTILKKIGSNPGLETTLKLLKDQIIPLLQ